MEVWLSIIIESKAPWNTSLMFYIGNNRNDKYMQNFSHKVIEIGFNFTFILDNYQRVTN